MQLVASSIKLDGFYRGQVVDNADPEMWGRVKAIIIGIFDSSITVSDLPWAVPAMPISSGAGVDFGTSVVPEVGSWLWFFFEKGDIYQPVFFASAPSGVHGLPSEIETNYPYRKVIKTKNGIVLIIDDEDSEIIVTNPSGSSITMDKDGNIEVSSTGTINISGAQVNINP